jgi:hypothetical protein
MNYWPEAMADEKNTDIVLDKIGLRLATTERYARHMGNVIDDALRAKIDVYQPEIGDVLARLEQVTA